MEKQKMMDRAVQAKFDGDLHTYSEYKHMLKQQGEWNEDDFLKQFVIYCASENYEWNFASDAKYMKGVRLALGFTQQTMAVKMGYGHQKDISNIERGEKKMSNQARKLLGMIFKYQLGA